MNPSQFIKEAQAGSPAAPPIPANLAALWGAFIYEGLLAHTLDIGRPNKILEKWKSGYIPLIAESCNSLSEVWLQIASRWNDQSAPLPGVFEFEVISPLGKFIGTYILENDGAMPPPDVLREEVSRLIAAFRLDDQVDE